MAYSFSRDLAARVLTFVLAYLIVKAFRAIVPRPLPRPF